MTVLLNGGQRWSCPNCSHRDLTFGQGNRFHECRGLAGLLAPMVPDGAEARVRTVLREDYVRGEDVRHDGNGRPVMAVAVEREDGVDVTVYAPTAHARRI